MKKKFLFRLGVGLSCIVLLAVFFFMKESRWSKYYKNKLYQAPSQVVCQAISKFQKQGKALDLGCGVGNDTALLLNQGWQVWAVDREPLALEMIKKRKDISLLLQDVTLINKKFEDLDFSSLPQVEFICAVNAMPFLSSAQFDEVWRKIVAKIEKNGRFAGHFFGTQYCGFHPKDAARMTFLTKNQVEQLFNEFDIEHFQEQEEDSKSGTGEAIHGHIFEVIARKK